MQHGLFITLEGSEGAGKSTQIDVIKTYLEKRQRKVECVREPGGTEIAEEIRTILKKSRTQEQMQDITEMLLMYAAREQLVPNFIKPSLNKGIDVICDRHDLSSIAYQGGGRGIPMEYLEAMRRMVLGSFHPNVTFLLDLDVNVGMQRVENRGGRDRFELAKMDFFLRVRETYLEFARKDPEHIIVIDASQPISKVSLDITSHLDKLLG